MVCIIKKFEGRRELITGITTTYQKQSVSLFRLYQDKFLETHGVEMTGDVIELGGEKRYDHSRFFPNARSFLCTNIAREFDQYLDITNMDLPDSSQECFVCSSVLAHLYDVPKALSEIDRTLKTGGQLLLTAPFAFPECDDVDFWRFACSFYQQSFKNYELRAFANFGGLISTVADVLQRPKHSRKRRYRVYKYLGIVVAASLGRFDTLDAFPLGYGIHAVKR